MNIVSACGKFLDQPKLVNGFKKSVPAILVAGGGIYGYNHVKKEPVEFRNNEAIRTIAVLSTTFVSALVAPKVAEKSVEQISKLISKFSKSKPHSEHHHCHHEHHHDEACDTKDLIEKFMKHTKGLSPDVEKILEKAKTKILFPTEIKKLYNEVGNSTKGKEFLSGDDGLIPDPEEVDFHHIFEEDIPKLSILGLVPVLGGMTGGIIGDKITNPNWKKHIPDKIKEGSYQYLANIFLCNVGAGAALYAMEKANVKNKAVRAVGMVGGIILTGVVFGSVIANFIGEKIINPLLGEKHKTKDIYSERVPEALDIGLHVDDIATVAALSGLKWIVPALPILYSVSGYRTGIGYRNKQQKEITI